LADGASKVRRQATGGVLDTVERADLLQRLAGKRRAVGLVEIEELAPDMSPAGDFADPAGLVQFAEAGIAVGLQDAAEAAEMALRTDALAVGAVAVEYRGAAEMPPRSRCAIRTHARERSAY
jgi:hypothetical protein